VDFSFFAHNLVWLVVNGKIQRSLCAGEKGRDFARENAEAATKPSGRAGAWTQLDMKTLSVSW
jgi:hypothetical protein